VGDDIFLVEDLGNNRIRLTPTPTHVSEAGTPVNKALLQHMENHLVPPGAIIMWSGAINDIPVGWALCDGSNGTPDLRNRFIVGAGGSYNVGNTGGSNTVTLSSSQMPRHDHGSGTLTTNTTGSHNHTYLRILVAAAGASGDVAPRPSSTTNETTSYDGGHNHTISGYTSYAGSGEAHENRPPYYALAYIMKL
jgi:microcystin-dependent protein